MGDTQGKAVTARSMVMFKTSNRRFKIASGRSYGLRDHIIYRALSHYQLWMIADHAVSRLVVQLVVSPGEWWCHPSYDITFGSATTRELSRFVARLRAWWYDQLYDRSQMPRLIYDRSNVATIYRAIGRGCQNWACVLSQDATSDSVIGRRIPRLIVRSVA